MTIHALWTSGTAGSTALAAALAIAATPAAAQSLPSIRPTDLLKMDPLALTRLVNESRPAPVPAEARAHILAGLPKKGEVQNLDDGARQKLAGLAPVLKAAQRETV